MATGVVEVTQTKILDILFLFVNKKTQGKS